jgi:hypothetical protein
VHRRTELLEVLRKDTLPDGHLSLCADRDRRKELFRVLEERKNPQKDLHWVAGHPERLSKRLLEQTESQEGI